VLASSPPEICQLQNRARFLEVPRYDKRSAACGIPPQAGPDSGKRLSIQNLETRERDLEEFMSNEYRDE